ncbi:MAG: LacI family DNA-binding transcriptional regulator [Anaerolineae bacterium]|nr:LacI family DNA-binding transcriptional regulator [Anaerolineae bacterium]
MTGKRPTISDVARRAFVSKTTVSHVLNGTRFVTPDTKQRVLDAIEALGYRPSTAARSLTTKRTGIVGMIISDASNQFFGEVLRGVEDVLGPKGYGLIVCNTDETLERERHYLDLLLSQQVEGVIAAATSQRWQELLRAEATRTPIVFVDRTFEGMEGPYVGVDNYAGAYRATSHLIESGRRRPGIIAGFQRLSTMRERLEGFKGAIADAGMPLVEERVVACPLAVDAGCEATRQILSLAERPDALLTSNNLLSLGAMLALQQMGLRCPQDVALIGFDDHPWARVCNPPLSVVRQPSRRMGQVAAETLCTLVEGREPADATVRLGCELILRQSCCTQHSLQENRGKHMDVSHGRGGT